jgi:glycosyltransferase involved in cell wall biosynthesis
VKILSVIEAFCHGGAQTVLLDLVLSMPQHQHRVVHFSRANGIASESSFLDALGRAGIPCLDTHWDSLRNEAPRSRLLDGFHPDVVLFHWWGKDPWMPWVLAPRTSRTPTFICVLHHGGIAAKAGYDRYVLVTGSQRPQVADIPVHRVRVIQNGIDLDRFPNQLDQYPELEARAHISSNPHFVVGRLSELREGKIPTNWVATLASYQLEDTRFVIAGDGALLPALRKTAIDLELESKVSFPGYIPRNKVAALLETFDVFCYVTSSAVECCPLVILEAMAAGVPVVAEARGGIPEIVIDGENGLLANSVEEVGNHLRGLRGDPVLRSRLSRGALITAEEFSLKNQIAAYGDLLAEIERKHESRGVRGFFPSPSEPE